MHVAVLQLASTRVMTVMVAVHRACEAVQALQRYDGPTCFAIPGNHDWIDGLETYQRHIQHRGWLGGWLLPQENSYFALHLPQGWWLFGLDLALLDDIDLCQCRCPWPPVRHLVRCSGSLPCRAYTVSPEHLFTPLELGMQMCA